MDIIKSLEWRYACRKFDDTKIVAEEKITLLKEAFNLTPTSFGLQPMKMIVIKDKKLQKELVPHCFGQEQVANASHVLAICIEENFSLNDIDNYFDLERETRNLSEETIAPFRKDVKGLYAQKTPKEIEQSSIYQTYIALGNLMTVCALEKIDACPMEGFIPSEIDKILNLKEKNLRSILLLPIGYRAEDDFLSKLKKVRKPINEIVTDF